MPFAIMRCKKLASMGSAAASLQHCYRERETHNADGNRTPDNQHFAAKSTDEAMGKLRELLPDKCRKDAVLAVEYVMTASPEWWGTASKQEQDEFFQRSREWLANKYGEDRIITSTVHRDETSPHLSAFVVPLTKDGRLPAKEFIGGRNQMSQDQTTFAKAVKHLGLERGIENSKAKHTTIQSYYARVNRPIQAIPTLDIPELTVKDRITFDKAEFSNRVAGAVIAQLKPTWEALRSKASELDALGNKAVALETRYKAVETREKALEVREAAIEGIESKAALSGNLMRENRSLKMEVEQLKRDVVQIDDLKQRANKADSAEEINKVLANAIIKGGETLEAARTRLKELFPEKFEKSKSSNDDLDFGH